MAESTVANLPPPLVKAALAKTSLAKAPPVEAPPVKASLVPGLAGLCQPPAFLVREAVLTDRPALATLSAAAFAHGLAALLPRDLRGRADAARFGCFFAATPGTLLLTEQEGVPVGCALATPHGGGEPARLLGLWVAPFATGRGTGSALLAAVEAAMLAGGASSLRVRVPSGQLRALGLFRRRGYAQQAAGLRPEPVLEAMLLHSVLSKRLVAAAPVAA